MVFHVFVLNIKEEMIMSSYPSVKQASKLFNFMNILKLSPFGYF